MCSNPKNPPMLRDRVKQMMRRMQMFSCAGSFSRATAAGTMHQDWRRDDDTGSEVAAAAGELPGGSLAVYVGREKRRYVLADEYVNHPLFKSLVARTNSSGRMSSSSGGTSSDFSSVEQQEMCIPCEVVLFEHLLWILSNEDDAEIRNSAEELVDFYACN